MKRSPRLVMLTLVAALAAPASAYANVGWWDWLDKLSGPGPFHNGFLLDYRLFCEVRVDEASTVGRPAAELNAFGENAAWTSSFREGQAGRQCRNNAVSKIDNRSLVTSYVEVRGGRITTEKQPLFSDVGDELVGKVAAHQVMGIFMRQLNPMLAVGAGAGWMWFSGDQVEGLPGRFVFTPITVAISPLKIFSGIEPQRAAGITIRVEELMLVGGLDAKDFNQSSRSSFQTNGDRVTSVSVVFDFFALFAKS